MGFLAIISDGSRSFITPVSVAAFLVCWLGYIVAYRLWLGPLAGFPGPKLAAVTGWYETYFECIRLGRYWVEIEKMHEEYGPIVRISPWEIHVNDPDWNEPYKVTSRVDKYHWYYRFSGSSEAGFGTSDHEKHRVRRKAQQGYFTLDAVSKFDPALEQITSKLCARIAEFKGTGQPVTLSNAFRCLATDVVTEFSFQKSYGLLDTPDFAVAFHKTLKDFTLIAQWNRHFGVILATMDMMPRNLVALIDPIGVAVVDFFNDFAVRTKEIMATYDPKASASGGPKKLNVIYQMLDSPELPASDKTEWRLALEVQTFVAAGTETTGNTLSVGTFHLLSDPEKVKKLKEEVQTAQRASPTPLVYQQLARLPYLSSVVLESHRISTSVAGRLPRVNTREEMRYKDKIIPINTPVSTTQRLTHLNPTIFPDPNSFIPERWMDPTERKRLERYLHPFGKGSRACIGLHLASSEIYVILAKLFSSFDMRLFSTTEDDIKQVHDFFSPFPDSERGLRVTVE